MADEEAKLVDESEENGKDEKVKEESIPNANEDEKKNKTNGKLIGFARVGRDGEQSPGLPGQALELPSGREGRHYCY